MKTTPLCSLLFLVLSTLNYQPSAWAQGTAFTYQGRLTDNGTPANGNYDLRFTIYDSTNNPGTVIAGPITNSPITLADGTFTVTLDFGASVFTGADRWLEIAARTTGGGAFTTLSPRQPLTPTPYALYAQAAGYRGWLVNETFNGRLPELAAATAIWRPLVPDPLTYARESLAFVRSLPRRPSRFSSS